MWFHPDFTEMECEAFVGSMGQAELPTSTAWEQSPGVCACGLASLDGREEGGGREERDMGWYVCPGSANLYYRWLCSQVTLASGEIVITFYSISYPQTGWNPFNTLVINTVTVCFLV